MASDITQSARDILNWHHSRLTWDQALALVAELIRRAEERDTLRAEVERLRAELAAAKGAGE